VQTLVSLFVCCGRAREVDGIRSMYGVSQTTNASVISVFLYLHLTLSMNLPLYHEKRLQQSIHSSAGNVNGSPRDKLSAGTR